jgi:hypothetical protein
MAISREIREVFKVRVITAKTGEEVFVAVDNAYGEYVATGNKRDKWGGDVPELYDLINLYASDKVKTEIAAIRQGVYA